MKNHASTFETITLSFDVMNFQTTSRLKISDPTCECVSKYVQIYRAYIKMTLEHILTEYLTKNDTSVYFAELKNLKPNAFKKLTKPKYL